MESNRNSASRTQFSVLCRCGLLLSLLFVLPTACLKNRSPAGTVERVVGGTGMSPGEFSYPRGIAVSPVDGCLFIVDKSARVQRFSPDGGVEMGWRMPEWANGKPTGLTVDGLNRVWVADTHYGRVITYDRDGKEMFRFGSQGEGPGQFVFPTSVGFDRHGFVYVGEYGGNDRISKFTSDRRYVMSFGGPDAGDARLARPTRIVCDESGILWVPDACNHRICRFSTDGRLLSSFGRAGSEPECLNYPYDIVLEDDDTMLIADHGNNRIARFSRNGKFLGAWGTLGRGIGQVAQPWGVARGVDSRVYVLDSWNDRMQIIRWEKS